MIARCYLRVSTEDQAKEGYSLGAQRDRLAAFALSQGWQAADYYVDDGVSAKNMNRPALKKLLAEIQAGEVVLVYKLDRLTRSVADLDYLLRKWEADGILFRSCTEDFNTTTAAGRLFIRLVADLAQWERENLAERTRMGMVRRAQEGEWNGGPSPFGYDAVAALERNGQKVRRVLTPNQFAPVVRELFERYVAGQGMRRLTLWLNREKGIKSSRGGAFTDASVSGILKNPVYAGLAAWDWGVKNGPKNPDAIVVAGKHAGIVPRELWEQAQRVREGRLALPPRHAAGIHLLTGIGRCGLCGSYLKVNADRRRAGHRFYRCGAYATKGTCSLSGIRAGELEANVADAVRSLVTELADAGRAAAWMAAHLREERKGRELVTTDDLRRQMVRARQAIAVWDAALEQGQIAFAVWQAKTGSHYACLADLEAQLRALADTPPVELVEEAMAANFRNFDAIWGAATPEERKTLLISFFREIRVYPDKQVVVVPRLALAYEATAVD